ncbi:MAG: type II toxin-antitoxin system VapC family toxin [Vicinamibacterales bacterium]
MLIRALVAADDTLDRLERHVRDGARFTCCTLVLYEWLRGPRTPDELRLQEELFSAMPIVEFGRAEALCASDLYRRLRRPRRREIDIAVAACAITRRARLWTLNPRDFADIPGLELA